MEKCSKFKIFLEMKGWKIAFNLAILLTVKIGLLLDYNELKPKVLEAEQHLLRILGFDFSQAQKNLN